jgi:translation initiation factor IF-3
MANQEMGRAVMTTVIEQIADSGTVEFAPRMEGRNLIMILAPK